MKRLLAAAAGAAAALALASPAGATNECRGFQVCVPIAGPWVIVPTGGGLSRRAVEYQLTCPRRHVVGGLDAELSLRGIDVRFAGKLGSPVNPGITTSRSALFMATYVGVSGPPVASFRPHIGCIPGGGGGQRVPTARSPVAPGQPTTRRVKTDRPGIRGDTAMGVSCTRRERLVGSAHAIGFYTRQPPDLTAARSVRASRQASGRRVTVAYTTITKHSLLAVIQVAAICAGGR